MAGVSRGGRTSWVGAHPRGRRLISVQVATARVDNETIAAAESQLTIVRAFMWLFAMFEVCEMHHSRWASGSCAW